MQSWKQQISSIKEQFAGDSFSSVLARGASGTFILKIIGTALAFVVQILLARVLGEEQYGIFVYVITWLMVLLLVGKLGIDTSLLKFAAAYRAKEQWGLFRGALKTGNRMTLIASSIVSILLAFFVLAIGKWIKPDLQITAWIGCAVLPVMALVQVRQAIMRSLQHVFLAVFPEFIIQPLLLAVFVVILVRSTHALTAPIAMILYLGAFIVSLIAISFWCAKLVSKQAEKTEEETSMKEWIAVSIPLLMMSGFNLINHRADIIMVGIIKDTTQAGFYFNAVKLANFLVWGLTAVNLVAAPLISHLFTQGKKQELQKIASLAALGIAIFTIPAGILVLLGGHWLLGLFNEASKTAYPALVFLVIAQCLNALAGSVGYLLTMTGYQKEAAYVIGITAFINITLNAILIPYYGLAGAAVATMISTIIWNLSMYIIVRKKLGIDPSIIGLFSGRMK
ncbi:MAG: flippase [bacterium]